MAKNDLPATMDHIERTTGQDQLVYIGHSQGTLIAFAGLSTNPEFAKKIKLFIALAPIVTIGNIMVPYLKTVAEITTVFSVSMAVIIRDGPFDFSWGGGAIPKKISSMSRMEGKKIEHH